MRSMTKQEAIEILTEMRDWNDYITQSDALQMAIDELEKKPAVSCEDTISRQAVKQEFAEWHKGGYEDCAFYKYLDKMPPVSVAEKTGRWIPVSERLPEDGTYLICTDDGYIATIMYDRSMGWLLDSNIIAWMPLPQPYKAESEDKCKNCKYYRNPDYTRCHECEAESEESDADR